MSKKDLLKIPREQGNLRLIDYNYLNNSVRESVTFYCDTGPTPDLISSVNSYYDWLVGFVEHYKEHTGQNSEYTFTNKLQQYDLVIHTGIPIKFRVDVNKHILQFFYDNKNLSQARKLVDSFIDRIWYGKPLESVK